MKSAFLGAAVVVITMGALTSLHAQYSPNFDDFDGGFTLSGQLITDPLADQWDTNDLTAQPDFVGEIAGYSTSITDHWGALGGLVVATGFPPTETTVDLWRTFSLPGGGNNGTFSVSMAVTSSTISRPNQDSFSWKFRQADGTDIVSIDFVPDTPTTLQIFWTDFAANQTSTTFGISYNAIYDLTATVSDLGGTPTLVVSLDPDGAPPPLEVINASLPGLTPGNIQRVAASWTLFDQTPTGATMTYPISYQQYGANGLLFQDYSVVPEPASVALVGLGAGLLLLRRRRSRSS